MFIWRQLSRSMALPMLVLVSGRPALTQQAPASPEHPWRYSAQQQPRDTERFSESASFVDASHTYSLVELIDLVFDKSQRALPERLMISASFRDDLERSVGHFPGDVP